jgi:DNA-binding response OmpR family regulator
MRHEGERAERVKVEAENSDLKFEIRRLRNLLIPPTTFAPELGLTALETKILNCLLARSPHLVAQHQIMDALYFDNPDKVPDYNLISVCIYHIRKKLNPLGINVERRRGLGLMLDEENGARLRAYQIKGGAL